MWLSKKEIMEGLDSSIPYDFIANNYWRIDDDNMRDLVLELVALYDRDEWEHVKDKLINNLCEYKNWDELEE